MPVRLTVNAARFASAAVAGATFLLDHDSGDSFRLDGVGTQLWECFKHGATFDDAVADVVATTGATTERVRADAATFVDDLVTLGALRHDG